MDIDLNKALEPIEGGIKLILGKQGELIEAQTQHGKRIEKLEAAAASTEEWNKEISRKLAESHRSINGGDRLLELIPSEKRHMVNMAELVGKENKETEKRTGRLMGILNDDPAAKYLAGEWFSNRVRMLVDPGLGRQLGERQDKISEILSFEKAALGETTTGTGVELVPSVVESEILRLIADNSIMRPLVRKIPMTTKTHLIPTRSSAFTAYVIAEAATITDSAPATPFSQTTMNAKKLGGFATLSLELLQDNVIAVADYLAQEFGEQVARLEDGQALEGPAEAATTYLGVTAASGVNSVSSGANGDFLRWQLLVDTIFKAGEAASLKGAAFFMHPSVMGAILKARASAVAVGDQSGGILYYGLDRLSGAWTPSILGYPVYTSTAILTNRTIATGTNRTHVYFGPPSTIIFGDLLGFQVDLNPYAKFASAQVDIRGIKRTGIVVGVPSAWTQYQRIDGAGAMI